MWQCLLPEGQVGGVSADLISLSPKVGPLTHATLTGVSVPLSMPLTLCAVVSSMYGKRMYVFVV